MASVPEINDANFESEVLKSDMPFLLDFSAEWCGPCKMVGPLVEQIGEEEKDKLRVGVIDIDKNPQTPAKFTVLSIPTLILFKGGEVKEQIIGALPKKAILERLTPHL
ncbi:MAG: thioredoxin [Planctomycetota bacterium]|jgi:thioredoxin 1